MRRILSTVALLFLIFCINSSIFSQDTQEIEVGIIEHLDEYLPDNLMFRGEDNEIVDINDLIDRPTILSFVYYNCPKMCKNLQQGLSDVIEESDLILGKDYQVFTISFDYRDTPEMGLQKKRNYANNISRDNSKFWYYLTSDSLNIYKITEAVGFKFKEVGNDFVHPSGLIVVSPKKKITRYIYGTKSAYASDETAIRYSPLQLKLSINEASMEQSRSTIGTALDFCFSYDADEKSYVFNVTKVAATVIIFFGVLLFLILVISSRAKRKKSKV